MFIRVELLTKLYTKVLSITSKHKTNGQMNGSEKRTSLRTTLLSITVKSFVVQAQSLNSIFGEKCSILQQCKSNYIRPRECYRVKELLMEIENVTNNFNLLLVVRYLIR